MIDIQSLKEHTKGRLRPSALSGRVKSSTLGTIETLTRDMREEARENPDSWTARIFGVAANLLPDFEKFERKIGRVKFNNFQRFAQIYPEYQFVFFGDSGQADSLTAELMVTDEKVKSEIVTTFIHDLGATARSPTFNGLDQSLVVKEDRAQSPGVILFRNHIQAAVLAHIHFKNLITTQQLAEVTKAGLKEFLWIEFPDNSARAVLKSQYREDAEDALKLLEEVPGQSDKNDVTAIRDQLKRGYLTPSA